MRAGGGIVGAIMARRRIIHEGNAYKAADGHGGTMAAYEDEQGQFEDYYPDYLPYTKKCSVTRDEGEAIIEAAYKRYAPNRKRPRLLLMNYKKRKSADNCSASYTVVTHTIWSAAGILDHNMLLHEIAHSLTWKQDWPAHGPEFMRMVIELNCWYLHLNVRTKVREAREAHGFSGHDDLVIGDDPTEVTWIRNKSK